MVEEDYIRGQFSWFKKQKWFHKTYEQFREDNFTAVPLFEKVTERLAAALLARKGVSYEEDTPVSHAEYENEQMDRLAAAVREHLDLRRIYEILEEGAQ